VPGLISIVLTLLVFLVFATPAMASNVAPAQQPAAPFADSGQTDIPAIKVYLDGKQLISTDSPQIIGGRTMVPFRAIFEALGASVDWENGTKTVTAKKYGSAMSLVIGEKSLVVNRQVIAIDQPGIIISNRTYIPLRAVLEAFGYAVDWDNSSRSVFVTELTALNINGGTTGVFHRRQARFSGFDGIRADVSLPFVTNIEAGNGSYIYFGFDWENDKGNAEGGFQFVEDPAHPLYNNWTAFLRQGSEWRWGNNISIKQGETLNAGFYTEHDAEGNVDLVFELNGQEVIRKRSVVDGFANSSVKAVIAIAMTEKFDGQNCYSKIIGADISNIEVRPTGYADYSDFSTYPLYSIWRPERGVSGMWYGTSICVPSYLHYEADGKISLYKHIEP